MTSFEKLSTGVTSDRIRLLQQMLQKKGIQVEASPVLARRTQDRPCVLSFAQQRLWFLHQLTPGDTAYNLVSAVRLTGDLDPGALAASLDEVVARQETLRTTFEAELDGEPLQRISPRGSWPLLRIDLGLLPESERESELRLAIQAVTRHPFDLSRGPLVGGALVRLAQGEHALILSMHHIVSDGWSMVLLVHEVAALYAAFAAGQPSPLMPLPLQYADYAVWQREWLRGKELERQLGFWREHLAGAPPVLELPSDRPRPPVRSGRGGTRPVRLTADCGAALAELARREGATLFMTLLGAWQVLLHRITRQDDLVVGTVLANRGRAEIERLIGFFVNSLAIRATLSPDRSFDALTGRLRDTVLAVFAHQDLPFERLVEELSPERSLAWTPIFQTVFSLQSRPFAPPEIPGIALASIPLKTGTAKFDLSLLLQEDGSEVAGSLEFNRDLFEDATAARIAGWFETLAAGIAANPARPLAELPLLTEAELREVLTEWSGSAPAPRPAAAIHRLFEEQVDRTPEAVAVVSDEGEVTYAELDRRANQLARHLISLGVGPEALVGVLAERSPDLIVSLLGILKAGGAYVPFDPATPPERLAFLLADTRTPVVLTREELAGRLPRTAARVVLLDSAEIARESAVRPDVDVAPEGLAYVMYTSGSTGQPKGVAVVHRAVVRLVRGSSFASFGPGEVWAQLAPASFDASTLEIWAALLHGARLAVLPAGALTLVELGEALVRHGVTSLWLTAGLFHQMVEENLAGLAPVRQLLAGGDTLSPEHVRAALAGLPGCQVINGYGPTENTTFTCCHPMASTDQVGASVSLGRPIANTRVYLLDSEMRPVPSWVTGELYTGGEGLARGYLGRPDLTAERFVPDPWSGEPGGRLYRTGDLARWRAGGTVDFLGRGDQQVKLRGFRVEPSEIEAGLSGLPTVREAAVVVQGTGTDKRLVAFLAGEREALDASSLRLFLEARLPAWMVPSAFVILDTLPLTANGKVDRRALAALAPEEDASTAASAAMPRTPVEELLVAAWAEILRRETVGIHDDFFELGGHSLLATRVISRVRSLFHVELPLSALFATPSVAGLAVAVEEARAASTGRAVAPPIVPVPRELQAGGLPLSFAQQRLWFLDQLEPESPAYNIPTALRLTGVLDRTALEAALDEVMARHEVLRTTFAAVDGEPVQRIEPHRSWRLPVIDLTGRVDAEAEARRLAAEEALRPFDLERGPLVRGALLRLGEHEHVALFTMHHIVSDGWSMGVLVREIAALYPAFAASRPSPLVPLPVQYADFACWQRSWLQGETLAAELAFWRERLAGAPPALELPTDRPRSAGARGSGGVFSVHLPASFGAALAALGRRAGATLFMTGLAAWNALLQRHTGQDDLMVGSPIANRNRTETEGLIGFFVNTLVLRSDLTGDLTYLDLVDRVRAVTLASYEHQDLPFERLVEELAPERSLAHSPLFQVMFIVQNASGGALELPGLTLAPLAIETNIVKFDLTLSLVETQESLHLTLSFDRALFDETSAERMLGHFQELLAGAVEEPGRSLQELPLLSAGERHQVTVEWNDTRLGAPGDLTLHRLFEAQVERSPSAPALSFRGQTLTYRELDIRANRLAHHLRHLGVGPEVIVGVFCERSPEMVVALLAILKSGGAYLPLSPEQPEERLSLLIRETGAPVLLTQERLAFRIPNYGGVRIFVDHDKAGKWPESAPAGAGAGAGNLAYVIYTSGSTGRPKGVAIEHRSAVTLVFWAATVFPPEDLAGVLASTAIYFDLSVFELFVTLSLGGRVFLVENVLELVSLDAGGELTLVNTVPSGITEVLRLEALPSSVRTVNLAGEPLKSPLVRQLYSLGSVRGVYNLYGPSEDTTYSTFARIDPDDDFPPIGAPVADTQVRLLDRRLVPVPVGTVGEIYLGGSGLARGYLDQPGLTADRFVPDPFAGRPGARMYRTGDLARYQTSGILEYLGRVDHQIKLRGFRIELGEIEAVLQRHPRVREIVVVVRRDREDDPRLAAYVVPEPVEEARGAAGRALADELRRHLQDRLPSYMIPSAFVLLEALPLTPNGKVDRKALPAPERSRAAAVAAGPRTPAEEVLAGIWSEVLGRERVGVGEDFFALGGHSLLAVRVLSRVRQAFGIDLPLRALFEEPTIAGLAVRVEQARGQEKGRPEPPPLVPVPRDADARLPLSFAQQRLWFLQQLEPASPQYNLPSALRLAGSLRVEGLAAALREIVRRHESLRTTFHSVAGAPFQRVHSEMIHDLPVVDLEVLAPPDRERETEGLVRSEARRPFDLERGPVLRARLLRLAADDHVLLVTMHHIASDGWSMGVLTRELTTLYQTACAGSPSPLLELPIQYPDFAVWQRGWLTGNALDLEISYWREQLAGAPASLEMRTDRPRPEVQSLRGAHHPFSLPADLSAALAALGQREGTTLFMTLLAAFQTLLARSTGQMDLSVGSPMAGRDRLEVEGLIGFFVNTLVLRTDLAGNPTFQALLARVRETVLDAHRHQDVPFEKLVEELRPERDLSRTPFFQAMLILQNVPQEGPEIPGLALRSLRMDSGTSKFDLTLALAAGNEGLQGGLEYCADLFDGTTTLRLLERFRTLLAGVVADPGRPLSELPLLSEAERAQILPGWDQTGLEQSFRSEPGKDQPASSSPTALHAIHALQIPRSELEIRIAEVWKELLGLDEIGMHDRLFDLGAHSLLMVQAFAKMREFLDDRLTLVDLFKYPTIGSLVSFLDPTPGKETLQLQRGFERSESRNAAQGQGSRDIAVVGLRGRYPKAKDLEQFWRNLCDGVEAISFFSEEELRSRGVSAHLLQDPAYVRAGSALEDFEWFDASFFGYSPREAEVMDPQQRIFLECAWEALEDAGYDPKRYPGAVGVFAGTSMSWYWMNLFSDPDLMAVQGTYQAMIGNDKDFLPTRVSYKLNLRGPSVNVQSACSTSLVAVHLACQSLLSGESDMALAGGVSASSVQGAGYTYSEGGILSPDGHCRAFDAQARGTVVGSGVAVVVLKRLADAIADGDTIRAVIKGSAINNDGSFKVGYTAPGVEGQANVIAEAQAVAGVEPETITYVEAHGTGTEVGDPIEVEALTAAWRQRTDRKSFCAIGSVKTNIGHLDAAAGVTGLVKTVLALQAAKLPPTLHFERPNPKIDFANSPFYVNAQLADWISDGPRRAGVSSFGLGGTNAHVVLEEAPPREPSGPSRPLQLLVLSTRANLETATDNLVAALRSHPETPLADVAYTLQVGRAHFDHRRVLVCRGREDALRALETRDPERLLTLVQEPVGRRVVFLFPGGGAQYADMGLDLYRQEPVFREEVDRCLEILAPHLGLELKPYLYPSLVAETPAGALSRTSTALPALFVTEIALAKLWMSWGVRPQALIGHSLGEYAAAYLAGVMSLEDALALVALRGRLFETLPEGAMLSVPLPEPEVLPLLNDRLSIAAINDVAQCVVSGPVEEIARLERELTERGLEVHKLHIEVAAHSSLVEPILEEFGTFLRSIRLQTPSIPFVSDVTGTWIRDEEAVDPGYWVRQLRHTVRFAAGIDTLLDAPNQVFLEMGPGRILSSFVRRHPRKAMGHEIFTTLRHINDSVSDLEFTFNLLGRLWLLGQEIDWAGFYADERRHRVQLPTYPFNRQRYWVERRPDAAALSRRRLAKKPEVADWFYAPSWRLAAWPASAATGEEPGAWLLFIDACGVGRELTDALAGQGQRVVTVSEGAAFARLSYDAYILDPASSTDYDALFQDLRSHGGIPRRIVHLWSVTADDPALLAPAAAVAERFDHAQDRGFYSLLRLAQSLLRQNVTDSVRIDVVANGLQRVDGRDSIHPEKATLLGLCQVLPQEYDHFSCRAIDVVLRSGQRRDLVGRLLAEVLRPAADHLVAFRDRRRWVRSLDPVRIEAPAGVAPALRERGIYLITGGLGRFGLNYARHLADRVRARLVLTGRSGLPPREAWPEWLETRGDDPVSRKIRRVQDLEARGAEVLVVSADVADEAQMRGVVEQARERFGGLHGVIHAAGLIGAETFRAIPETGIREAEAHFRPKLRGAVVLARVLEGLDLDFCLMISSISTVLGGLGFAAYSAANLALDAFAQERDAAGSAPWMSVGWDAWAEREDEERGRSAVGAELAGLAMAPDEGLDVFDRCLSMLGVPQLVVSTGDLEARVRRWSRGPADAGTDTAAAAEPSSLHDRPNLPQPYVAPRDESEGVIADLWQKLLGIQQIGVHDNFFELGGDSLRATQLASGLRRTFQLNVPLRALFDAPSVAGQGEVIARLRAEQSEPSAQRKDETPVLAPIERRRKTLLDELEDLDLLSEEGLEALWDGEMTTPGGLE